ncbi:unnamed protein product [Heligmosomoides polygyrus]|uniref:Uncharacterized protein n=1 Tax=Heligmosomoides polygyrus TaxID=6339 RepID=A0A183FG02_HELPZ|nr:unnamed protein product [Heligmosomoides polygyrus]
MPTCSARPRLAMHDCRRVRHVYGIARHGCRRVQHVYGIARHGCRRVQHVYGSPCTMSMFNNRFQYAVPPLQL